MADKIRVTVWNEYRHELSEEKIREMKKKSKEVAILAKDNH